MISITGSIFAIFQHKSICRYFLSSATMNKPLPLFCHNISNNSFFCFKIIPECLRFKLLTSIAENGFLHECPCGVNYSFGVNLFCFKIKFNKVSRKFNLLISYFCIVIKVYLLSIERTYNGIFSIIIDRCINYSSILSYGYL
jgi:hypothetical protein